MSAACARAAFARRRLARSGLRPREVLSWLTRHSAELASEAADALAVGPSAGGQTVDPDAGPAPAATAVRRRRGRACLGIQVRIYLPYRVDQYPSFSP